MSNLESLHSKFKSSNSVDVERATVTREEYETVVGLEYDVLRLNALNSTQLDTYQNMFDVVVEERKRLIDINNNQDADIKTLSGEIARLGRESSSKSSTIANLNKDINILKEALAAHGEEAAK